MIFQRTIHGESGRRAVPATHLADMLLGIAATKYQDTAPGPWPTALLGLLEPSFRMTFASPTN